MLKKNPRILYVGNISEDTTPGQLHTAFIPFGEIRTIDIPQESISKAFKGFAFVEFDEEDDAQHALFNMHNSEFQGRVLRVEVARPMKTRDVLNRPIWADERYFEEYVAKDNVQEANEDKSLHSDS